MKKSLIAIALLTFGFGLLISSASYATAPKAGDIPDLRVIAPNGITSALDLDDYALDNDDYVFETDTDLSWDVQAGGLAPAHSLTGNNVLSLNSGAAAGDLGTYTFEVEDATGQTDSDTSAFKASSAIGLYPALSQDHLLLPSASAPGYTYVQDIVGVTGAVVLVQTDDVVTAGATGTNWQEVYISAVYDASNNAAYSPRVTLANGTGSASVTGLTAAINSAGQFTLTATAGGLSAPVIVGFKGINNSDPDDWSGVSALVSNALLSKRREAPIQEVSPGYDIDDGFETALGRIAQVGFSGTPHNRTFNRLNGPAKNTWVSNVKQAANISGGTYYPSVTVVDDASLPTGLQGADLDFAGDHSGNALKVALDGATAPAVRAAFLNLNSPVPAQAGVAYAVDLSVGSSATTSAAAPQIHLGIHTNGFTEVSVQTLGPSAAGSSGPTNAGWMRMRAYIEPSAAGLADSSLSGLALTILVINEAATPVDVYIDNVRIYQTAMPDDLAWGSAKVAIAGRPDVSVGTRVREYVDPAALLAGQNVYGNFENGAGALGPNSATTGGNVNAWFHSGATLPTGMTATVTTSSPATRIEAGDLNWLEVQFSGAAVGAAAQVRTRLMAANTTGLAFAPGVYVMSLDYVTPSGGTAPTTLTAVSDDQFKTFAYFSSAQGTNGAIRRVRVAATLRDLDKMIYLFGFVSVSTSTQICRIDNVQVDLINDMTEYFDESLFQ